MKTYNILLITACLLQLPTLSYTAQAAAATAEAADETARAAASAYKQTIVLMLQLMHTQEATRHAAISAKIALNQAHSETLQATSHAIKAASAVPEAASKIHAVTKALISLNKDIEAATKATDLAFDLLRKECQILSTRADETAARLALVEAHSAERFAIQEMIIGDQRAIYARQIHALQAAATGTR